MRRRESGGQWPPFFLLDPDSLPQISVAEQMGSAARLRLDPLRGAMFTATFGSRRSGGFVEL
jgi:hypothetical protein